MASYFNFGTMGAVSTGMASMDTFHHFLAIECGQPTMEEGDDYFCGDKSLITFKPKYARQTYAAINLTPYKMRCPHVAAFEAMQKHSKSNPGLKIRLPRLRDIGDLKRLVIVQATIISDIDMYHACANYLELKEDDYDINELQSERKRLSELWTAGVEAPEEPEQSQTSVTKCQDPNCDNFADATGLCNVHKKTTE
jgi:hypothetical protein